MGKERLDKFISNQLNIARSTVRTGVRRGLAQVNGNIIKNTGYLINADGDNVNYDGNNVVYKKYIYIVLNKPAGVITASKDKSVKTVLDLVPENMRRRNLSPVGRLDKDTTGLLIITDDGDFAHKCISPKSGISKTYIAELDGDIDEKIICEFERGVVLADGCRCKPSKLFRIDENIVRVVITEGKYHQIKRMFGVFGLGVNSLHRESIGNYVLPHDLKTGECKEIAEIARKIGI